MRRNKNEKRWGNQYSRQKDGLCKDPEMCQSLVGSKKNWKPEEND